MDRLKKHYDKLIFAGILVIAALVGGGPHSSAMPQPESETPSLDTTVTPVISHNEETAGPAGALGSDRTPLKNIFTRKANGELPLLKIEEAIIADLETGEAYLEINSEKRWPMASITKLTTAAYAAARMPKDEIVTLAARDFSALGGDIGHVLNAGEAYTANDLIRAMLTFSSNEAGEALANSFGRTDFLLGMNELVRNWGLKETNFADPTGLSASNQSTAKELVTLARHIYNEHPDLLEMSRIPRAVLTELGTGKKLPVDNINTFAGTPSFIGGKTGFTDEAQGNLLSIFTYEGRPIVIVVMGTADRFGETKKMLTWFQTNFALAR